MASLYPPDRGENPIGFQELLPFPAARLNGEFPFDVVLSCQVGDRPCDLERAVIFRSSCRKLRAGYFGRQLTWIIHNDQNGPRRGPSARARESTRATSSRIGPSSQRSAGSGRSGGSAPGSRAARADSGPFPFRSRFSSEPCTSARPARSGPGGPPPRAE